VNILFLLVIIAVIFVILQLLIVLVVAMVAIVHVPESSLAHHAWLVHLHWHFPCVHSYHLLIVLVDPAISEIVCLPLEGLLPVEVELLVDLVYRQVVFLVIFLFVFQPALALQVWYSLIELLIMVYVLLLVNDSPGHVVRGTLRDQIVLLHHGSMGLLLELCCCLFLQLMRVLMMMEVEGLGLHQSGVVVLLMRSGLGLMRVIHQRLRWVHGTG